jgi:hypothetical protein
MRFMIRSHHIAAQLIAEHQRDLRVSARPSWRVSALFGRGTAEPEFVPPARIAGGDGPAPTAARAPLAGPPALAGRPELRVRRGPIAGGVPAHVAAASARRARTPDRPSR